jgi:hypothetical protein
MVSDGGTSRTIYYYRSNPNPILLRNLPSTALDRKRASARSGYSGALWRTLARRVREKQKGETALHSTSLNKDRRVELMGFGEWPAPRVSIKIGAMN